MMIAYLSLMVHHQAEPGFSIIPVCYLNTTRLLIFQEGIKPNCWPGAFLFPSLKGIKLFHDHYPLLELFGPGWLYRYSVFTNFLLKINFILPQKILMNGIL